jgi:hypothetical protein
MANTVIELRHSTVSGNTPTSLANGEIAINTFDGKIFYRGGFSNTIQTIERYEGPAGLDTEIQFNDSGVLGSSANLTFDKLSGLLETGNVTANTIATKDYIQFGDGTRQFTANSGSAITNFGDYFPLGDWGYLDDEFSAFGENLVVEYDCRDEPITPKNFLLEKDFGFLT